MVKKQTHARIEKSLLMEMKTSYPGMSFNQIVKLSWNNQKRIERTINRIFNDKTFKR